MCWWYPAVCIIAVFDISWDWQGMQRCQLPAVPPWPPRPSHSLLGLAPTFLLRSHQFLCKSYQDYQDWVLLGRNVFVLTDIRRRLFSSRVSLTFIFLHNSIWKVLNKFQFAEFYAIFAENHRLCTLKYQSAHWVFVTSLLSGDPPCTSLDSTSWRTLAGRNIQQ